MRSRIRRELVNLGVTKAGTSGLRLWLVWAIGMGGCADGVFAPHRPAASDRRAPRPILDRLRDTYPELASNRFLVVADFERPVQGQMFTMRTPGQQGFFHPSARRSRPETGAGSLEVLFADSSDMLIAWSSPGGDWSLPSDWRAYGLLLMSVHCASGPAAIGLEIHGRRADEVYRRNGLLLETGWNTLGIDLADVGHSVDLSYVAHVGWRVEHPDQSVTLHLDDLILVDNRRELWGSPDAPAGSLYVIHEGRRIHVGATTRFELVFYDGEIVEWYDLEADPNRQRNCVNGSRTASAALGPIPVLVERHAKSENSPDDLSPLPSPARDFSLDGRRGWGPENAVIAVRQSVLEASAVRTVIECNRSIRTLGAPAGGPGPQRPESAQDVSLSVRYAVTPQGRVFVQTECPTVGAGWQAREIGLAFTCSVAGGFRLYCHSVPIELANDDQPTGSFILFARGHDLSGRSDLLCVPHKPKSLPDAVRLGGGDAERVAAMFRAGSLTRPLQQWALLMLLWPDDLEDPEAAALLATAYGRPAELQIGTGKLVRTDPGDLDNDGYNESQGCYVIEPEADRARLRLDVRDRPCWYPMFKVAGTRGRRVWAYADGQILPTETRTADGSVLLSLDRVLDRPVDIEIVVEGGGESTRARTPRGAASS